MLRHGRRIVHQQHAARQAKPDRAGDQAVRIVLVLRPAGLTVRRKRPGIGGRAERDGKGRARRGAGRRGHPRHCFAAKRRVEKRQIGAGGERPPGRCFAVVFHKLDRHARGGRRIAEQRAITRRWRDHNDAQGKQFVGHALTP